MPLSGSSHTNQAVLLCVWVPVRASYFQPTLLFGFFRKGLSREEMKKGSLQEGTIVVGGEFLGRTGIRLKSLPLYKLTATGEGGLRGTI